jgi:hypothetical protein
VGALQSVPFTIEWHGDKFRLTAAANGQSATVGYDGEHGWTLGAGRVQEITPDLQLYKLRRLGRPLLSTHIREEMTQLTAEPPQALRDLTPGSSPTAVNVISGSSWPGVLDRLFFDAATGVLLRRTIMTSAALGMTLEERYDYTDYRPEEGVQVPHAITHTTAFSIDVLTISGVTPSPATDDNRFLKPKGPGGGY